LREKTKQNMAHGLSHIFHAHNPGLVVLSYLLAVFASYVALEIAGRIKTSGAGNRQAWLLASAIAMGGGIWAMHFVAMLGIRLSFPVTYDLPITALSMAAAIIFSGIGLYAVFTRYADWRHFAVGGVLMGLGVAAMHYLGMAALNMPAKASYSAPIVVLSVAVSIIASGAALWLAFNLSQFFLRAGSAFIMGAAVFGMHFTAMAGFTASPIPGAPLPEGGLSPFNLAEGVAATSVLILLVGLAFVYHDRMKRRLSQLTVAQFGLSAISNEDIVNVFHDAVDTARKGLGVEYGSVATVNARSGLVRAVSAGRGEPNVSNYNMANAYPNSIVKYAVDHNRVMAFEDIAKQREFVLPDPLRELNIVSGIIVPKIVKGGDITLICMFSTQSRRFAQEDVEFLQSLADVLTILHERDVALTHLRLRDRALEAITQGITIVDPTQATYPTVYSNPAFAAMTGYSEEEVASISTLALLPHGDISPFSGGDMGTSIRVEVPVKRKDGSLFTNNVVIAPIRDRAGNVTHYVSVHEDVTQLRSDQRRLDQKVREQSALAQFSVIAFQSENLPEMLLRAAEFARQATDTDFAGVVDVDVGNDTIRDIGRVGWDSAMPDTYKLSLLPPQALVPMVARAKQGICFTDITTTTQFVPDEVLLSVGVRSGVVLAVESANKITTMFYMFSKQVREYTQDDVEFLSTLLNLIVAVRERHEALTRLRLRDRALESISQGITISDESSPDTPIIYTNPAFAKMTGYSVAEIIGLKSKHFLASDAPAGILDVISLNRAKRRAARFESRTRRRDGTSFLDSVATSPIFNAEGELTHYVAVHEDMTESHQRDLQLRESQKMEAVGQLTGGIAHDFNNLLTVVKANAEDLKSELGSAPVLERQADMVLQAADRGADLVRQLMAFARKQELEPKLINLNAVLDSFVKLVRRTMPENIIIDVVQHQNLPQVRVDPSRLENAALNLIINARDAMHDGGRIVIETGVSTLDQDYIKLNPGIRTGEYVLVSVSDTGDGMTKAVLEKAFQPFFTTKEIGRGTGLGLSMVYGFVKQSGGHAKLYSEVGHGTTVKIYLPPASSGVEDAGEDAQSVGGTQHRGSGRILLVEDDELVRESVCAKLERLGYRITAVESAAAAIAALEEDAAYNLVFTDVIMPGAMSGADLAREVRYRWPTIALLMTSGYTEASALGKVKMPEGVRLLSKPYSNADLVDSLETAMARVGGQK